MTRIILFFSVFLGFRLQAQLADPVKWEFALSSSDIHVGDTVEIIAKGTIETNWYLYSNDFDPSLGPVLTEFTFTSKEGYKLLGKTKAIHPKKKYDNTFSGNITYFVEHAEFRQKIILLTQKPVIAFMIEYQACNDALGRCVPGETEYSFSDLLVKPSIKKVVPQQKNTQTKKTATGSPESVPNTSISQLESEKQKLMQKDVNDITKLIQRDSINELIIAELKDSIQKLQGTEIAAQVDTLQSKIPAVVINKKDRGDLTQKTSMWLFILVAFGAGLLSIVTPCVFPMVPMTVSFFTNSSHTRKEAIRKALIYGLSIILIYTFVGVVIAKIFGAEFANFLSTHWFPNLLFTAIFIAFALSFFGLFEITLPNSFINKVDQQSDKGGYAGLFFMAFTIVLVSFSCTGPIVSTILLSAAGGEIIMPIAGMLAYSSAFALPFVLFALFPNWLKSMPKSGGWLNTVKVSLGFVELALALKFFSIADLVEHWHILNRDRFLIVWMLIFFILALYLFGIIKFSAHDKGPIGGLRKILAAIILLFVLYLGSGFFGGSLKEISGYIPPMDDGTDKTDKLCNTPKYNDLLHLPLDLQGYFDYKEAVACAKEKGKPLFIDFTGHGCANCREMENNVWADPNVRKKLDEDFVIVALYVDERTALPESEQYISSKDNKLKTTIGKRNHDFENTRYNFVAQPFYVILDPNTEKELTQPIAYERNIDTFIDFLEEGKTNFKKLNGKF